MGTDWMETLPAGFLARMKKMLGGEYEDFLAAYASDGGSHDAAAVEPDGTAGGTLKDGSGIIPDGTAAGAPSEKPSRYAALRVNPRKEDPEAFRKSGLFHLEPVPWERRGFYYHPERGDRPGRHPYHAAGVYYIQEPSAMAVVALSGIRPGERVLDLCAAPGGKSTQAAACLQGKGWLLCNEIHPGRAKILSQNIERLGYANVVVSNESAERLAGRFPSFFDTVIVDAPCSGEGMFRKEEAAVRDWSPENVRRCAERQQEILEQAAAMTGEGGTLVYSTCTFAPQEDEETVAVFLSNHSEFTMADLPNMIGGEKMAEYGFDTGHPEWVEIPGILENIRAGLSKTIRIWPHRTKGEGHYIARLTKVGEKDLSGHAMEVNFRERKDMDPGDGARNDRKSESGCRVDGRQEGGHRIDREPGNSTKNENRFGRRKRPGTRGTKGRNTGDSSAAELWKAFARENLAKESQEYVEQAFQEGRIALFGSQLYLLPEVLNLTGLHILRPGLHLGTVKKDRLEPAHALAMTLRPAQAARMMDISSDSPEALRWLCGEALDRDGAKGWTLVCVDRHSMGWGKAGGGIIKNHYPKGLRIQK